MTHLDKEVSEHFGGKVVRKDLTKLVKGFDNHIHDRSILIDNNWKIVLARGLDILQKTGGWFNINEYIQEKRICKACEITYIKT